MAADLPRLGIGLAEDPVDWTVPGLDAILLAGSVSYLSYIVGSSIYHHWFQGKVTDYIDDGHCNNWEWVENNGDPFSLGLSNATYLHARCGVGNSDTFAGSPKDSFSTQGQWYSFWTYVINAPSIVHGSLYQVAATYCNGASPCYVRAASVSNVADLSGPLSTAPNGTSVSAGWADPSTGAGITTRSDPYGGGPSTPNPQCLQGGVVMACSSVSSTGGPANPAYGWPSPWPSDGYANPEANNLRCQLSPATFACPQVDSTNNDWETTGGPVVTMPNCYGESPDACEAAVNAALAAAGSSVTAAYTTAPAPTYDPNIPLGAVAATIPAAGAETDASSVVEEVNEENQPAQACSAGVDNYHLSEHTGKMLSVFYVKECNFTSPPNILLSAIAWACTSQPDPNFAEISNGDFGCIPDAAIQDQSVTAAGLPRGSDAFLNGPAYDPNKWYIAYAYSNYDSPVVEPGFSQAVPPGTWGG
jgi:hypothetical protein